MTSISNTHPSYLLAALLATVTACTINKDLLTTGDDTSSTGTSISGSSTDADDSSGASDDGTTDKPTGSTGSSGEPPDPDTSTGGSTGSTGSSGEPLDPPETDTSTVGPDPDYVRDCQPGDFTCTDLGCADNEYVEESQCYKPCTPGEIGAVDSECDEPERPFCSQVGRSFDGDFGCNGCAHICIAGPLNYCEYDIGVCSP